mmetsp:Transcript_96589/g.300836  ORF Transcript_96589/g.300836 Transcript_96589/m.300836 type:complete len:226 (+) Transcript_96589:1941-2618(+)
MILRPSDPMTMMATKSRKLDHAVIPSGLPSTKAHQVYARRGTTCRGMNMTQRIGNIMWAPRTRALRASNGLVSEKRCWHGDQTCSGSWPRNLVMYQMSTMKARKQSMVGVKTPTTSMTVHDNASARRGTLITMPTATLNTIRARHTTRLNISVSRAASSFMPPSTGRDQTQMVMPSSTVTAIAMATVRLLISSGLLDRTKNASVWLLLNLMDHWYCLASKVGPPL